MPKLTARKIASLSDAGMYADGEGLYLRVGPTGAKSWILRTTIRGRRTSTGKPLRWEGGLGGLSVVSLAEARELARELRKVAKEGGDPSKVRDHEDLTFMEAAEKVLDGLRPTWRSERHAKIWWASMENNVFPKLGNRALQSIQSGDVLDVLSPIWAQKHETARRVRQRMTTVFDWAKGAGHYVGENPVTAVAKSLPRVNQRAQHMPALPWRDVPAFLDELRQREGVSARTLEFIILTAARSGEARGARWDEIDGDCWTVPAERMKTGLPHRVPLCPRALELLEAVKGLDAELCFPSPSLGRDGKARQQSDTVFSALFKRMKVEGITTHGFRSTFRDWCTESAHAQREVSEAALSHSTGNAVERAYARSDLFERRMALMEAWGQYCVGESGKVVRLAR
ncbi:tyrosine-type recombinase/integrase [Gymnodinialimonas ulvae]|uniref:tyrosine-type recombinase/integrase n=1 Tax=Gymnodinialimonas ulvae TaxID=3126504 RepID=UPI0030A1D664